MKKKIALLLIIFMVGTWCVYAEDDDETMVGVVLILAVGIVLTILLLSFGGTADDVNKLWFGQNNRGANPTLTGLNNPILNHTTLGVTGDKIFLGAQFSW